MEVLWIVLCLFLLYSTVTHLDLNIFFSIIICNRILNIALCTLYCDIIAYPIPYIIVCIY